MLHPRTIIFSLLTVFILADLFVVVWVFHGDFFDYWNGQNMRTSEFATVKAKIHTDQEIPGFVKQSLKAKKETLPRRGLYFFSDVGPATGEEFLVDIEKKVMQYWVGGRKSVADGRIIQLSDAHVSEIVSFVNTIWASESDFESERYTARVAITILVLADRGVYRYFEFDSLPGGVVEQLGGYLSEISGVVN